MTGPDARTRRDDPAQEPVLPEPAERAVEQAVSPVAPGHSPTSGVVVDLPAVAPPAPARPTMLLAVGAGAAVATVVLAVAVAMRAPAVQSFDSGVHAWVLAHRAGADLALARTVTWGGATVVALPALVVVGAAARVHAGPRTRLGAGALLAGVVSMGVVLGNGVNAWLGRARPPVGDWAGAAGGAAFPSGHTLTATLFALGCAWVVGPRLPRSRAWRVGQWCAAVGYAATVGWSRVWLGVHWPTDVIGGWCLALAYGAAAAALVTVARRRRPAPESLPLLRS